MHCPEGRIHWTGFEIAFYWWSCVDGDVESAQSAVKAIFGLAAAWHTFANA
jgi:monoamine oxidase